MLAHKRLSIEYCNCRGICQTLFLMQMLPSSLKTPQTAVHFGLYDYLHLLKMAGKVSNHAFAEVTVQSTRMSFPGLNVTIIALYIKKSSELIKLCTFSLEH